MRHDDSSLGMISARRDDQDTEGLSEKGPEGLPEREME